jgi:transcriptional regulator with XRE-family HTH domain
MNGATTAGRDHLPNKLDVAIGQNIRERRLALKLSQTSLAQTIGITFQQIQKYERGYNRVSFSRMVDIAHALDWRVVDLIGDLDRDAVSSPLFQRDTGHLREPGGPELIAAYAELPPALRKLVLNLVVGISKGRSAPTAE